MPLFYLSFFLVVISVVLYHLFQKVTPSDVNPALSLLVTYGAAFALSLLLFVFYPLKTALPQALSRVNWASWALGASIVGIELGFLLAYRSGWHMSLAGIATNTTAALLLLPVGLLFFREKLSWVNIAGVLICIVGLLMINWRR